LRALDPHGRTDDGLLDATNLLLGMLNGIATRPFMATPANHPGLVEVVKNLFLHGFLGTAHGDEPAGAPGARRRDAEAAHVG